MFNDTIEGSRARMAGAGGCVPDGTTFWVHLSAEEPVERRG